MEVQDHINALWKAEHDLMSIIFGRYYPVEDGEPMQSDTLGP